MNRGRCLCADIGWEYDGPVESALNCHCTMCRKAHGSAFASYVYGPDTQFRWTVGENRVQQFRSSAKGKRAFCPRCGSVVPSLDNGYAFMPAGNMQADADYVMGAHIFVASKAPWHDITDRLPQHAEYPPGIDSAPADDRPRTAPTADAIGGSCLCGQVTFEFDLPIKRFVNCHCSRCRYSRSAAYSTQVFVDHHQFRWLSGEELLESYKVPDAKAFAPAFCRDCGSLVPKVYSESVAVIPAGSLDDDPQSTPALHIFVDSKAPWYEIPDQIPQFAELPPRS